MTHFEDLSLIFRLAPFSMKNPWMIWVPELPETTSKFAPENGWERKMIVSFWGNFLAGAMIAMAC